MAQAEGTEARLVEDATEVELSWLAGRRRIGLTAGASAPSYLVEDLVTALGGLGPVTVRETGPTSEHVQFTLPREVG